MISSLTCPFLSFNFILSPNIFLSEGAESPISGEAMGRVKIYPNADVLIEDD